MHIVFLINQYNGNSSVTIQEKVHVQVDNQIWLNPAAEISLQSLQSWSLEKIGRKQLLKFGLGIQMLRTYSNRRLVYII